MTTGSWNKSSGKMILKKSWSGANTPKGQPLRENAYSMSGESGLWGGVTQNRDSPNGAWHDSGNINTSSPTGTGGQNEIPNIENKLFYRAMGRALGAYKGHDFNAAVSVGEGLETAVMCGDLLKRVIKAGWALRKGDVSEALRSIAGGTKGTGHSRFGIDGNEIKVAPSLKGDGRVQSEFWLLNRYGIVPAMGDLYNSAEAYRTLVTGRLEENRNRWEGHASDSVSWNGAKYPTLWDCPAKKQYSTRVIVYTKGELSMPQSLGLTNPALFAWEMLPLSFVFDWAMPLGEYLDLRFGIPPEMIGKVITSYRTQLTMDGRNYSSKNWSRRQKSFWSRYKKTTLKRTVTNGLVIPPPTFTPPGDIFNASRILDLCALGKVLLQPSARGKSKKNIFGEAKEIRMVGHTYI